MNFRPLALVAIAAGALTTLAPARTLTHAGTLIDGLADTPATKSPWW